MEQLINTMLANTQIPQMAPAAKKGETAQKDGFQKLLEQKQDAAQTSPRQEKAETAQDPQDAGKIQDAETEPQTELEDGRELEERMALAAMAMMQTTVVPAEQVMTPEAPEAAEEIAPLAAETLLTPEERSFAPEQGQKELEAPVEGGEVQLAPDQPEAKEASPEAIQAPEAPRETEGRTVEVRVENARPQETESSDTEETPDFQGADTETPVFEDVKAVPVKVGEAHKAPEMEKPVEKQLAPRLAEALHNGETRVELQLTPENLGKVTVEMTWSKDGGLVVQLHAENRGTQDLLSRNTTELAQLLGRETAQEVRVEVPRQEESQRQDLYQQQQEQQRQGRQQERREKRETRSEDFLQQLRLGLIPVDGE